MSPIQYKVVIQLPMKLHFLQGVVGVGYGGMEPPHLRFLEQRPFLTF